MLPVQTLINYLEQLAPRRLALDWDNVGLQLGSLQGTAKKILVALDVDRQVLDEAVTAGADFIISHHPILFRPLTSLRTDLPVGAIISDALAAGIRIFAVHTNLDIAQGGVNDILAERLGLTNCEVLRVTGRESLEKIVVFVPAGHEDNISRAMSAAGAGWIGNYSHCTFQTGGTGTFMPLDGSSPFLGKQGKLERVEEFRLETIVPAPLRGQVIQAMLKAHPYEEVAFDVYPLQNEGQAYGLGRIGRLAASCSLSAFCREVKDKLKVRELRVTGDLQRVVKKVAVSGGNGADLIQAASFSGADVLVTGDLKYHEAKDAESVGLAVIDAGHDATEKIIIPELCRYLEAKIKEGGYNTEVLTSKISTTPWKFI